ncbi:hypothetical protein M3Y97_00369800 [Aphelenchoides bicaudatus]|nr:hypothetical protein M3Y97_00369800 [Aphelenchoides bicaudatus]
MDVKTKPYSDTQRWVCVYPVYLNSKRTLENGRRIPKDKAVEDPTVGEIVDILKHAGLNCLLEKGKMHPRDQIREPNFQGRIRVQLKNDDGSFCNEDFQTRKRLLLYTAEMIPKLKTRQTDATPGSSQQANTGATGGKKKKKR